MTARRSLLLNATSLVLGLGLILLPLLARAGVFPDLSVELGSHAASTATNHTIEFVTSQGLSVAAHTIKVRYASGFSLSGVAFTDIDLAVDDDTACNGPWTDRTLESGASPSADAWGIAVSGQTVTFTSSATATADIAADRCVQIQIGTNAASGSNRIVNPGSAGSYEIDVIRGRDTGENGEQGMASVAIASTPTVTVSATVSSSGSPASSPTPTPTDTAAPAISNIVVSNITATSATVAWQTNEAASTVLSYGQTTAYAIGNLSDTSFRTSHTRSLTGLTSGTEYHFQIQATDSAGNAGLSPDTTFTTLDVTAPTISNVQVINITETSAMVTWITDEPSTSAVVISSASINLSDATLVTTHQVLVTGLSPNTTYATTLTSADASGNSASASTSFTTLTDVPPTNVSNLVAVPGIGLNMLSWRNPSDADLAGVIVRFSQTAPPTTVADGTPLFDGLAEMYTHTGLTPGVRYYYTVFAYDAVGNVASGAVATAIPLADDDHIEDETDEEDESDDSDVHDDVPSDSDAADSTPTDATGGPSVVVPTDATSVDTTGGPSVVVPADVLGGPLDGTPSVATDGTPADIELPPTTVDASDRIPSGDVSFFVARETIALSARRGQLAVLGARPLSVELNLASASSEVATVELVVGASRYFMNPDSVLVADRDDTLAIVDDASRYRASVQTPRASTTLAVVVTYLDGRVQTIPFSLNVQGDGSVSSTDADVALRDPRITLLSNSASFDATPYGQANPILSDTGTFAWYVPNGTYRVEVTANGFVTLTSAALRVSDNIVNPVLQISPALSPLDEELARALEEADGALETIGAVTRVFADRGVQSVRIVRQDADVQQAATVAAPVTTAVAATTAVTLATSFNLFRFVHYLFTAPFLLFNRQRRKKWGVVYDSLRKIPVDLAIVRLRDLASGRIVKSQVTDTHGRYLFIVEPGRYALTVNKPGFAFPTDHLKEQKRDGEFLDLYHGEEVTVTEASATIAANIPLDPESAKERPPLRVMLGRWGRRAQYVLSIVGLIVAAVVAVIQPTLWTIAILVLQVLVLAFFVRLARPKKPTGWGIVYDVHTRRPLANAIVRIFEPKFNKLLETKVTDGQGRYAFLVGPAEYYATYQKPAYKMVEVRPIDRTDAKEPTFVSLNVGLERGRTPMQADGTASEE